MRLASFFSTLCLSEVLFAAMVLYMFQVERYSSSEPQPLTPDLWAFWLATDDLCTAGNMCMLQISDKLISIILGPGFVALTVQMVTMPTSIVLCHLACRAVETNDS